MPLITPETVKRTLKDVYGYDISDESAGAVANTAGAMLSLAQHLGTLGLDGVEPPFGYATLMTEAIRTAAKK
ncbi:MAG TPA: hypothetical protein VJX23_01245 [Candidatus Binataceae bacterium]|nr:hypothetical protein [Candidatus Binataceae bacterium]